MSIEKKRINKTTYLYDREAGEVGEIKGPYRPGSVWKTEVYKVKPEFDMAWWQEELTPVQRGKCTPEADRIIAAICHGQSNGIDADLFDGVPKCLGYLFKTKKKAVEAFETRHEKKASVT